MFLNSYDLTMYCQGMNDYGWLSFGSNRAEQSSQRLPCFSAKRSFDRWLAGFHALFWEILGQATDWIVMEATPPPRGMASRYPSSSRKVSLYILFLRKPFAEQRGLWQQGSCWASGTSNTRRSNDSGHTKHPTREHPRLLDPGQAWAAARLHSQGSDDAEFAMACLSKSTRKRMTALTGLRPWSRQRACSWSHVPPFAGFNSKLCLLTSVTATSRLRSTQHSL